MNTTTSEKRCSERVLISKPIKIKLTTEPSTQQTPSNTELDTRDWEKAKLLDLSDCGMGILVNQPLDDSQTLLVSLSLPTYDNESQLYLLTKIVRKLKVRNQFLVGVEFLNQTPHERIVLQDFFHYHKRFYA